MSHASTTRQRLGLSHPTALDVQDGIFTHMSGTSIGGGADSWDWLGMSVSSWSLSIWAAWGELSGQLSHLVAGLPQSENSKRPRWSCKFFYDLVSEALWRHFCGILLPKMSHGGQSRFKGRGFTEYTWQEAWVTGERTLKTKTTAGQGPFFFLRISDQPVFLAFGKYPQWSWGALQTENSHGEPIL